MPPILAQRKNLETEQKLVEMPKYRSMSPIGPKDKDNHSKTPAKGMREMFPLKLNRSVVVVSKQPF